MEDGQFGSPRRFPRFGTGAWVCSRAVDSYPVRSSAAPSLEKCHPEPPPECSSSKFVDQGTGRGARRWALTTHSGGSSGNRCEARFGTALSEPSDGLEDRGAHPMDRLVCVDVAYRNGHRPLERMLGTVTAGGTRSGCWQLTSADPHPQR